MAGLLDMGQSMTRNHLTPTLKRSRWAELPTVIQRNPEVAKYTLHRVSYVQYTQPHEVVNDNSRFNVLKRFCKDAQSRLPATISLQCSSVVINAMERLSTGLVSVSFLLSHCTVALVHLYGYALAITG